MKMPRVRLAMVAFALLVSLATACWFVTWVRRGGIGIADALLQRADDLAWNDRWVEAEPLFKSSELLYLRQGRRSKALYAHVSQIPANAESSSLARTISELTQDLTRPGAQDPETRLRILEIRGMIEVNYDARLARATWAQVAELATRQRRFLLASRATGEQGIAAFMLGDIAQAKRRVIAAWTVSKLAHDSAAHVRYASLYGAGLCELHRYQEALTPLNDAINTAAKDPRVGYPSLAINSKVDALRGLGRYQEALALANQALGHIPNRSLKGHYYQILSTRGSVFEDLGDPNHAIADYQEALDDAAQLDLWRGISEVGGQLALVYEHQGKLPQGLEAINRAIDANTRIPDELYLVPRNLAIKAEILERMGSKQESDSLYQKSAALIDSLLDHAPTPNVERLLLAELSEVYSGYFASMCGEHQYDKALGILEAARGRVEAQALQHHTYLEPHLATADEQRLISLNLALINTNDPAQRDELIHKIYETELGLDSRSLEGITATQPVRLVQLQHDLAPNEVLIEYVLADPSSYALAITNSSVHSYQLGRKSALEANATAYRTEIRRQQSDSSLASRLFEDLIAPMPEYRAKSALVVVPDGHLHLLPFDALVDRGQYLIATHTISTSPSATVFDILRHRAEKGSRDPLPYVGVAAWIKKSDSRTAIFRAVSGPQRDQFDPLPESKKEVEAIAGSLPKPSTLLLGGDATETHFKSLPLDNYNVIHLALHGYVDEDYPDRSALVFAPQREPTDDGLLQVREIRNLHLNAQLVTLSACNSGVGPVSEDGVANLMNAFIEAGADTVVSTLWELEDHSTEHLMADFYGRLAQKQPKVAALRQAKLDLMHEGFSPYFWASFELAGDPNGIL